jgi:hypothetical protein
MANEKPKRKNKRHIPKELDKRRNNQQPTKFDKIDMEKLKELCSIGCTIMEAEAVLRLDTETITKAVKHFTGMSWKEFFKKHSTDFKMSLRRLQMRSAEGDYDIDNNKYNIVPSVPMQIWLGKQFLGQKDRNETVVEEKTNIPQFEWADAEDVTNQKQLEDGEKEEQDEADSFEGTSEDDQ